MVIAGPSEEELMIGKEAEFTQIPEPSPGGPRRGDSVPVRAGSRSELPVRQDAQLLPGLDDSCARR
jgi:hypothetical protein